LMAPDEPSPRALSYDPLLYFCLYILYKTTASIERHLYGRRDMSGIVFIGPFIGFSLFPLYQGSHNSFYKPVYGSFFFFTKRFCFFSWNILKRYFENLQHYFSYEFAYFLLLQGSRNSFYKPVYGSFFFFTNLSMDLSSSLQNVSVSFHERK